ncbi:SigE family RNA polymerase sigma factor [Cellulomonas sp. NS3]|uniref:SigE family RNA polymerase sigma factor n=1 Tax=Cellulomonas sp. NS3 TaxID=2973977 RepID=UPI0037BE48FC
MEPGGPPVPEERVDVELLAARVSTDDPDHEAEFAAFMRESAPALARTAWLLTGDEHRAQDLVQLALMRTYLAWPRARQRDPLAYARRVLANARIDAWRKVRREVLTAPHDLPDGTVPSEARLHADRDQLVRALQTLSTRQRRVVVLRHLVGLSEQEVADDLGVSVGTVKSTASRGLAQLRVALGDPRTSAGASAGGRPRTGVIDPSTADGKETSR